MEGTKGKQKDSYSQRFWDRWRDSCESKRCRTQRRQKPRRLGRIAINGEIFKGGISCGSSDQAKNSHSYLSNARNRVEKRRETIGETARVEQMLRVFFQFTPPFELPTIFPPVFLLVPGSKDGDKCETRKVFSLLQTLINFCFFRSFASRNYSAK